MSNCKAALDQLEYTQQWLDYGILTEAHLQEQVAALATGEDQHTEHYRYQTLSSYIMERQFIHSEALHKLLEVIAHDPDSSMASSAAILLLKQAYLTDEQFEMVGRCLADFGDWTQKEIARQHERRSKATFKD